MWNDVYFVKKLVPLVIVISIRLTKKCILQIIKNIFFLKQVFAECFTIMTLIVVVNAMRGYGAEERSETSDTSAASEIHNHQLSLSEASSTNMSTSTYEISNSNMSTCHHGWFKFQITKQTFLWFQKNLFFLKISELKL